METSASCWNVSYIYIDLELYVNPASDPFSVLIMDEKGNRARFHGQGHLLSYLELFKISRR